MQTKAEELAEKHWMESVDHNTGCKEWCVKGSFLAGWRSRGDEDLKILSDCGNQCPECRQDVMELDLWNIESSSNESDT